MAVLTETLAKLLFVGSLLTLIAVTDSNSTETQVFNNNNMTTSDSSVGVNGVNVTSMPPATQNNSTVLPSNTPVTISSTTKSPVTSGSPSTAASPSQTTLVSMSSTRSTPDAPTTVLTSLSSTTPSDAPGSSTSQQLTSSTSSSAATSPVLISSVTSPASSITLNVLNNTIESLITSTSSVAALTTTNNNNTSTTTTTTVNLSVISPTVISTSTTTVVPTTNINSTAIPNSTILPLTSTQSTASTTIKVNVTLSVTTSTILPTTTESSTTHSSTHTILPTLHLSSSTPAPTTSSSPTATISTLLRTSSQLNNLSSAATSAVSSSASSSSTGFVAPEVSTATSSTAASQAASSPTTLSVTSMSQASLSVIQSTAASGRDSVGLGVGLGIGLGVPVIVAVVVIVFCCWKRKQEEMMHSGSRKHSSRRLRWPFRYAPSRTTVPPRTGYDNLTADFMNDEIEMTFPEEEVLAVPPARTSAYIDIKDFLEYVACRQTNLATYHAEFASLPSKQIRSATDAQKSHNDTKNRYTNVLPFNANRVTIGSNHYINASFIDGFNKKNVYIATQGPKQATTADFWLMVWQYNCPKIVMVTNLEECGTPKCSKYWPGSDVNEELYGDITVQLKEERAERHWIERNFCLRKDTERRYVTQYQYTMWPDQDVPVNCSSILEFHDSVFKDDNKSLVSRDSPIVVHCSAGVGRTGTFIAIDILLEQAKFEGRIDLMGCIDKLRRQRMMMVQSLAQFIFLHHAMLETLLLGHVAVPCPEFNLTAFELSHPVSSNDISTIQLQYDVLEVLKLQNNPVLFSTANCTDYKPKNRSSTLLPMDGYITFLTPTEEDNNIYINAVFVAGVQNNKEFIVTQLPLPNTATDFWRLVKDESCVAVVMLNNLSDRSEQYWPNDGKTLRSGQIEIINVGEIVADDIQITDLQLVYNEKASRQRDSDGRVIRQQSPGVTAKTNNSLTVRHLRLLNWTDNSPSPDDKSTLLELCEQVSLCQHKSPGGKILVHCLYGAERSGLFCALLNVICGIRLGNEIDVFNAVKLIRRSRPEFITSMHQYKLLYELADAFLSTDRQSSADYSQS